MKLNNCFTSVFKQTMVDNGFSRSGIMFYRMRGRMLQGVRLETINPYKITFSTFPYWLCPKRSFFVEPDLRKGGWVQAGGMIMPNIYFAPDSDEQNTKNMESVLHVFRDMVLPHLDRVCNEAEYFQMILNCPKDIMPSTSIDKPLIRVHEILTAEMFLYNELVRLTPMSAVDAVQQWYENCYRSYMEFAKKMGKTEEYIRHEEEYMLRSRDTILRRIDRLHQEGFAKVYDGMCAEMKQQISEQLKIRIDV